MNAIALRLRRGNASSSEHSRVFAISKASASILVFFVILCFCSDSALRNFFRKRAIRFENGCMDFCHSSSARSRLQSRCASSSMTASNSKRVTSIFTGLFNVRHLRLPGEWGIKLRSDWIWFLLRLRDKSCVPFLRNAPSTISSASRYRAFVDSSLRTQSTYRLSKIDISILAYGVRKERGKASPGAYSYGYFIRIFR